MKKVILFLLFSCTGFLLKAQQPELYLKKSLADADIKSVEATTSGGSIAIAGVNNTDARLEVYVNTNNGRRHLSEDEIQEVIQKYYDLSIHTAHNQLTVVCKAKGGMNRGRNSLSVSFKIYVPHKVATRLHTSGGSIALRDISGRQQFSTSGGSLDIDRVSGTIDGRTSGGSISLAGAKGDINLHTSGGSISAGHSSGSIRLVTSGGSVNAHDVDGTLYIHTSGGSVNMHDISGTLEAATSGGNMRITLSGLEKSLKLGDSGGNIAIRLPGAKGFDLQLSATKINFPSVSQFSGSIEKDEVAGKINGGGPMVQADADGNINVTVQ